MLKVWISGRFHLENTCNPSISIYLPDSFTVYRLDLLMTIRWGILATGRIANTFASGVKQSKLGVLHAVASRNKKKARLFAQHHPTLKRTHGTYEALIQDPEIDAVYIATPHTDHAAWTIRALNAGKAVLCEKPMGLNHAEVMAMVQAASSNHAFLMEAFMYRVHPQTQKIVELLKAGVIGELRHIEAQFGFQVPFDPTSRLFAQELAGGGIMDVGCYPVSFSRLLAGAPVSLSGAAHLGATGVDEWASALLTFKNDVTAQLTTAVRVNLDNRATIYGSTGSIDVPQPWNPNQADGQWSIRVKSQPEQTDEVVNGTSGNIYAEEADHLAECIESGQFQSPLMSWDDSLGNAQILDLWRREIGLEYEREKPANLGPALPANKRDRPPIPKVTMRGLAKAASRLVMGCDNQPSMSHAAVMWDDFIHRGGNCFDTAYVYGQGKMERLFGHWHQARGNRDDIVLIGKGAHTPNCYPEAIKQELDVSLDRLQTDHIDLYFMHRDNLDIPVDEFISALNDEVERGRIGSFGGSNWSLTRIQQANHWADKHNVQGLSAVSNNFSLARMVSPVWPGVASADHAEFIDYLTEHQMPLFPWSSQARGFFTDWGGQVLHNGSGHRLAATGAEPSAEELLRVWDSTENRTRRKRAQSLADQKGVELIHIALAYVLTQPFPTYPLIGPRTLHETDSSLAALECHLSAEDLAWLRDD